MSSPITDRELAELKTRVNAGGGDAVISRRLLDEVFRLRAIRGDDVRAELQAAAEWLEATESNLADQSEKLKEKAAAAHQALTEFAEQREAVEEIRSENASLRGQVDILSTANAELTAKLEKLEAAEDVDDEADAPDAPVEA